MVKGAKRIKHAAGAGQLVRQREKLRPVHSDGQHALYGFFALSLNRYFIHQNGPPAYGACLAPD